MVGEDSPVEGILEEGTPAADILVVAGNLAPDILVEAGNLVADNPVVVGSLVGDTLVAGLGQADIVPVDRGPGDEALAHAQIFQGSVDTGEAY